MTNNQLTVYDADKARKVAVKLEKQVGLYQRQGKAKPMALTAKPMQLQIVRETYRRGDARPSSSSTTVTTKSHSKRVVGYNSAVVTKEESTSVRWKDSRGTTQVKVTDREARRITRR